MKHLPLIALTLRICLLALSLCLPTGLCWRTVAAQPQPATSDLPAQPVTRELAGGQIHTYQITLKTGQLLQARAEQRGIDIKLRLYEPAGALLSERNWPNGTHGPEPLSAIAVQPGVYRLEITAGQAKAKPGVYTIKGAVIEQPTLQDRRRITAEKALQEAAWLQENQSAAVRRTAIRKYETAVTLLRAQGDKYGEALALQNLWALYTSQGKGQAGLPILGGRVLKLYRDIGDKNGEGTTLADIGGLYWDRSDLDTALARYQEALPLLQAIGNKSREAQTLNDIGTVYADLGNPELNLKHYQDALKAAQEAGDEIGIATITNNIGEVYQRLGRLAEAKPLFETALRMRQELKDESGESISQIDLGGLYYTLGEFETALKHFQKAAELAEKVGEKFNAAIAYHNLGGVNSELGHYAQAEKNIKQALLLRRQLGYPIGVALSLNKLAGLCLRTNRPALALTHAREALLLSRQVNARSDIGESLSNLGQAQLALGRLAQAGNTLAQALPVEREVKDKQGEANSLGALMGVAQGLGNPRLAVFYGKQALATYQQVRANIAPLDKRLKITYVRNTEAQYRKMAELLLRQQRRAEAHQVLSLFREEDFYEELRQANAGGNEAGKISLTPGEEQAAQQFGQLLEQIAVVNREAASLRVNDKLTGEEKRRLSELDRNAEQRSRDFSILQTRLAAGFKSAAPAGELLTETPETRALQADLQALSTQAQTKAVALYTLQGESGYRILLITPDKLVAPDTPDTSPAEVTQAVQRFVKDVRDPDSDAKESGAALHKIMVAPVAAELRAAQAQVLMWSLEGELRNVPVAALYDPEQKQYLAQQYRAPLFSPGRRSNVLAAANPQVNVLVAAMSVGAVPLPHALAEARAIVRDGEAGNAPFAGLRLENSEFTASNLKAALATGKYGILHLVTHFTLNDKDPIQSYFLLGDNQQLTLAKMGEAQISFAGLELLALSACQTGVNAKDSFGKEIESVGVLAQRQGAKAVLASLWPVDDNSAARLMAEFYRLYHAAPNLGKAEALRRAQEAMLSGRAPAGSQPPLIAQGQTIRTRDSKNPFKKVSQAVRHEHPYYWAPFVLIGNWQ